MPRLALLALFLLLAACGATPEASQAPAPTSAPPTVAPSATTAPTEAPTETPMPTATTEPTAEPTAAPAADTKALEDTYIALVSLDALAALMDDTAAKMQRGEADGFAALATIQLVAEQLQQVKAVLDKGAPTPDLGEPWNQGNLAHSMIGLTARRWLDKEINSADIPGYTAQVRAQLGPAIELVERYLANEAGIPREQLEAARARAIESIQSGPPPPP